MKLLFPKSDIQYLADRYDEYWKNQNNPSRVDKSIIKRIPKVQQQCYLSKCDLKTVVDWKSPRVRPHIIKNENDYIKDITSFSFSATNERAKIEVLTCLDGVSYRMASVILHFFHKDQYPILDFRALWSIGIRKGNYSFSLWWNYVLFCRDAAKQNKIDMRTLDKALWQYSQENQT